MIDLLYITSASFSGSTLLTLLLAAHDRIATLGELKGSAMGDIDTYACSCGTPIRCCGFWSRLGAELTRRGVGFDLARFGTHFRMLASGSLADRVVRAAVRGRFFEAARGAALRLLPGATRELAAILERNRVVVEAACALRGATSFLDGSKEPNRLKYMIVSGLWNVRAIHLVRDGRGVTYSLLRRQRGLPTANRARLVSAAARHWRSVNESCERVIRLLPPDRVARVRYEDLCRAPEAALRPILALAGIGAQQPPRDFGSIEHHIVGNPMRLRRGQIQLDEKWRAGLSAGELKLFEAQAGEVNRRYGYA